VVERVILITGSGSGIGAAICRRLAGPGTGVLVHAKSNREGVEKVAAAARAAGAAAITVLGDLADPATGAALVVQAVEAFGRLDVLIANAGFPDRRPFGTLDRAGFDYVHDVVTGGLFEMCTAALPHLGSVRDGRVVSISTHNAHVFRTDYPFYPASAAAKAGLEALTRTLAVQLGPHGVTVNCVVPGLIRKDPGTPQFLSPEEWKGFAAKIPLGRIGEPDDVAATVAFLCSREAGYITGQLLHVNGGLI
jgi:NAD(P)-dependent dehydrogenase (short-subunit alcohol dehydrogenase family)